MLAHISAHGRQRVVVADHAQRIVQAACADAGEVGRHVHVGRAFLHARGHGARTVGAPVALHVARQVLFEPFDRVEQHLPGGEADGAVRCGVHGPGGGAQRLDVGLRAVPGENCVKLLHAGGEPGPARRALAARVGQKHPGDGVGVVDGALARRDGSEPFCGMLCDARVGLFRVRRSLYGQSRHGPPISLHSRFVRPANSLQYEAGRAALAREGGQWTQCAHGRGTHRLERPPSSGAVCVRGCLRRPLSGFRARRRRRRESARPRSWPLWI